jgi:hypothetical protein
MGKLRKLLRLVRPANESVSCCEDCRRAAQMRVEKQSAQKTATQ